MGPELEIHLLNSLRQRVNVVGQGRDRHFGSERQAWRLTSRSCLQAREFRPDFEHVFPILIDDPCQVVEKARQGQVLLPGICFDVFELEGKPKSKGVYQLKALELESLGVSSGRVGIQVVAKGQCDLSVSGLVVALPLTRT